MVVFDNSTIAALATPNGVGAIGVIRLSGTAALHIAEKVFRGKKLSKQQSHTAHFGVLYDIESQIIIDEVLVTIFKAPKSYTGEDVVEISCHGSPFILQQALAVLVRCGARLAEPGEFTMRAFLNGKMDLAQAEAVADLIQAESHTAHQTAINQIRGSFSSQIQQLRQQLIDFVALLELELDFSEEDVEFADRLRLLQIVQDLLNSVKELLRASVQGNLFKEGIITVIAGRPNSGKSTLLNALLNEERAIVSDIAGTTRDVIEEKITIDGILFRLIDTAGIREATDTIEKLGIQKTFEKVARASILLYVFDTSAASEITIAEDLEKIQRKGLHLLLVGNKTDLCHEHQLGMLHYSIRESGYDYPIFEISALNKANLEDLKDYLVAIIKSSNVTQEQTTTANTRHYQSLIEAEAELSHVAAGLKSGQSSELLSLNIRHTLFALGKITGEITNEDILSSIFSKFCIGK